MLLRLLLGIERVALSNTSYWNLVCYFSLRQAGSHPCIVVHSAYRKDDAHRVLCESTFARGEALVPFAGVCGVLIIHNFSTYWRLPYGTTLCTVIEKDRFRRERLSILDESTLTEL